MTASIAVSGRVNFAAGVRVVLESQNFVAFVPCHARWLGEMQIYPRRHFRELADLDDEGATDLGRMPKAVRLKYDSLWGFPIPLMMMVRQRPVASIRTFIFISSSAPFSVVRPGSNTWRVWRAGQGLS